MIGLTAIAALLLLSGDGDRLQLARKLESDGQHLAAIREFQAALEDSPDQAEVWTEMAEARMGAGQTREAIGDLSRAVRLDPTGVRQQKDLAGAVEKSDNPQRALLEWRRVSQIATGPDQVEAESHVQRILSALGQAPESGSAPAAQAVAAPAPKPVQASPPQSVHVAGSDPADVKKAVELWKGGKRDQALEILRNLIHRKPTPEAYYYAGVMRLEEKKFDMAEFNLRKATPDKQVGASAWYWLGRCLDSRGKPKDALEAYRKSLSASPKGEFALEARARLEGPKSDKSRPEPAAKPREVAPESAPQVLPDSLRGAYSWYPPDLRFPPGDGSTAGKMLDDAAVQSAKKQHDLALSTLEQLRLKESASPAAELAPLAGALVYDAMGLPTNALSQVQSFLKDHPANPLADYARLVEGVTFLRAGRADSAASVLGPLPLASKTSLWTESVRQSALAEALRLSGKHAESVSALLLAFQAETDARQRRSLALRIGRESSKAGTPQQALDPLTEARKGCDRSGACLEVSISEADLLWAAGKAAQAQAIYEEVVKTWPQSTEAPWAIYQIGSALDGQGRHGEAMSTWKDLAAKYPGNYWSAQARLRLEDAVWQGRYPEGR
ncbi:MAG TPA: tetratricopeptide repeat protein [Fibrobacteria bacterium]|nr:tetratricopeptide repeat protein [Fibrobacteria bacterium]